MKAFAGEDQKFTGEQSTIGEDGSVMLAVNALGSITVLQEAVPVEPAQPARHLPSSTEGTVDIDYLVKTGLVKRPGDWSMSE